MGRKKQATPIRREPSSEVIPSLASTVAQRREEMNATSNGRDEKPNGTVHIGKGALLTVVPRQAGFTEFAVCIGGIYASFLSWALLQERITTTSYGPASSPKVFRFPVFLNTVQSVFAALAGYAYLRLASPKGSHPSIFPNRKALYPLALVAITSSLASPFGYASLKHIDYITYILAKSCKLLPVMALHLTIFRKRYPLYKYAVVAAVTAGVAVFTLHQPSKKKSSSSSSGIPAGGSSSWGLFLLAINLLFDGLTNSTQDYIFQTFKSFSGPQMMCAQNLLNTLLTASYLLASPLLSAHTPALASYLGMPPASGNAGGEFSAALAFLTQYPTVARDVIGFAACGAIGQVFIFYTLAHFSSLLLVTVTVTRKMLTMMLSVVWFGHRLSPMQWVGVSLVFGGVGAEGLIQRREKLKKEAEKRRKTDGEGEGKKEL